MLTPIDEIRAQAVVTVRQSLGLAKPPADWTYEERVAYNKALAEFIAAHADSFTQQDITNAGVVLAANYAPLADTSTLAELGQFGEAFAGEIVNAADKVGDVGRGALDAVSLAGKLLPLVVIGVGVYFILKAKKDLAL